MKDQFFKPLVKQPNSSIPKLKAFQKLKSLEELNPKPKKQMKFNKLSSFLK